MRPRDHAAGASGELPPPPADPPSTAISGDAATAPASGTTPAPRRSVLAAKPGLLFQNKILSECFSLVTTPLRTHDAPGILWITCPSLSPLRLSSTIVANMLNYCFTTLPERFSVAMSSLGVFSTKVASRNVANIILARGAQKLGTTLFLLHASQAAAEAAVHCRSELEKEPVPKESLQVGPGSNGKVIAQVKRSDQLSALPSSSRAAT